MSDFSQDATHPGRRVLWLLDDQDKAEVDRLLSTGLTITCRCRFGRLEQVTLDEVRLADIDPEPSKTCGIYSRSRPRRLWLPQGHGEGF